MLAGELLGAAGFARYKSRITRAPVSSRCTIPLLQERPELSRSRSERSGDGGVAALAERQGLPAYTDRFLRGGNGGERG